GDQGRPHAHTLPQKQQLGRDLHLPRDVVAGARNPEARRAQRRASGCCGRILNRDGRTPESVTPPHTLTVRSSTAPPARQIRVVTNRSDRSVPRPPTRTSVDECARALRRATRDAPPCCRKSTTS